MRSLIALFRVHWCAILGFLLPVATALAETPAPLRVMSFNVRNSKAVDGENAWEKRKGLFFAVIGAFHPDLIGFQEVLKDQHDAIAEKMGDYEFQGVARDDGDQKGEWALLGYRKDRFSELGTGTFWLSEQPDQAGSRGWDAKLPRICTWVRLREKASDRTLLFANTHFDHKGVQARLHASQLLSKTLPELAAGGAAILTGDLNITEDQPAYQELVAPAEKSALHWIDSFREMHPDRGPEEMSAHGFKGGTTGSRIDFIFHTKAVAAASATIEQVAGQEGRWASDHYPVTAVLEWK